MKRTTFYFSLFIYSLLFDVQELWEFCYLSLTANANLVGGTAFIAIILFTTSSSFLHGIEFQENVKSYLVDTRPHKICLFTCIKELMHHVLSPFFCDNKEFTMTYAFLPMSDVRQLIVVLIQYENLSLFRNIYLCQLKTFFKTCLILCYICWIFPVTGQQKY